MADKSAEQLLIEFMGQRQQHDLVLAGEIGELKGMLKQALHNDKEQDKRIDDLYDKIAEVRKDVEELKIKDGVSSTKLGAIVAVITAIGMLLLEKGWSLLIGNK